MNWIDEKAMEEGYYFNFNIFMIALGFIIIVLLTDYYGAFAVRPIVNKELKRTISEMTIEEIKDDYSIYRIATVDNLDSMRSKIEREANSRLKGKYKINLNSARSEVTESGKVFINLEGQVEYKLLITSKKEEISVKVKGRSKAQRFDVE